MANERPPKPSRLLNISELDRLDFVKRLAITAMFSDDDFMQILVLKGGAALDLIHKVSARASVDVDFSMEGDLPFELPETRTRLHRALKSTFGDHNFHVFDVVLTEVPIGIKDVFGFWGGYQLEFKLIERDKGASLGTDAEALRRNAVMIGKRGKFRIDLSKHEHCAPKMATDLNGYRIYVYTPEMIVAEKLRAICQQTHSYGALVKRSVVPRARDFLDICTVIATCGLDMFTPENRSLVASVFAAKRVSLDLLDEVQNQRDFHRTDFPSVLDTVRRGSKLLSFDEYFDATIALMRDLKAARDM